MELVEQIKSIDGVRAVRVLKSATAVVPASYMVFTNFNRYQIPFAFPIVKTVFLFMLIILICHDFTTFIDDTLAAELTVLRHSLLFWILCCFRYFSRKWHKIPAGEFVR